MDQLYNLWTQEVEAKTCWQAQGFSDPLSAEFKATLISIMRTYIREPKRKERNKERRMRESGAGKKAKKQRC